jgi:transposase InsO family protein
MPPRSRNHLLPTGPDTPHATAASSLVSPSAILRQNARSTSRRIGGRPGERIAGRPVLVVIHPAARPTNTSTVEVLRRPPEPAQYTSIAFTERVAEAGAAPSVGSVGDAYDNALAETTIGLFKTELIKPRGPWRTVEQVEIATLEYVDWFNHRRLHSTCGDIPPAELEAAHYRQHRPNPEPAHSSP